MDDSVLCGGQNAKLISHVSEAISSSQGTTFLSLSIEATVEAEAKGKKALEYARREYSRVSLKTRRISSCGSGMRGLVGWKAKEGEWRKEERALAKEELSAWKKEERKKEEERLRVKASRQRWSVSCRQPTEEKLEATVRE